MAAGHVLRLGFVALLVESLIVGDLLDVATAVGAAAFTLVPYAVERLRSTRVPGAVHLAFVVMPLVEASGRVLELYEGHPVPFDLFAHFTEVGAIAVVLLLTFDTLASHVGLLRSAVAAVVAGTAVALAIGIGWEAIEAYFDPMFTGTFQHGAVDTSADIAAGAVGGALGGVLAARYRSAAEGRRMRPAGT